MHGSRAQVQTSITHRHLLSGVSLGSQEHLSLHLSTPIAHICRHPESRITSTISVLAAKPHAVDLELSSSPANALEHTDGIGETPSDSAYGYTIP